MEIAGSILLLLLVRWHAAIALGGAKDVNLLITRQNIGDIFTPEGTTSCEPESCVGLSSGTAAALPGGDLCKCQCHPHLPAFREDLRICVDDIHECVLAPFVGGSTSQQIPFVFLPLKGQIIHPSKEISFSGIQTPVCAVSGAKFLTEAGWVDLRNPVDTDVPFRLFRDEGRTFLQWIGESNLRLKMSGRLVLVYLMCRELATVEPISTSRPTLFSPCVAFRVVGTPTKYLNNVSEVAFAPDAQSTSTTSDHLSISEYVAIGICSILLGLIYVASVFLYLHLRKRNKTSSSSSSLSAGQKLQTDDNLATAEEGIVKNNPLLSMVAHFQPADTVYSDSTGSDTDISPDVVQHNDERKKSQHQLTSALIHPHYTPTPRHFEPNYQDLPSIEKHPEENVSIVETLDMRDDRIDCVKALTGTLRKKLYFNPAYFEPQLLLAPPPAALEFLAKIREVIAIAKQKMDAKRFAPSLICIPEEEAAERRAPASRRGSAISLKRANSRRRACAGCPGCDPPALREPCHSCAGGEASKQRSIRKWLEDVPVLEGRAERPRKRVRSPTRSLPPDDAASQVAAPPRARSERARSPAPRPPQHTKAKAPLPPPDMIHEAMAVEEVRIPTLTKQQMKAVIDEFSLQRGLLNEPVVVPTPKLIDYEADSLERLGGGKGGYSTPSEYADLSSSQPSPSLSAALPMDEEMTMQNAIINRRTGNMTVSKLNVAEVLQAEDEHDYELIVLKNGSLQKQGLFKLPELLQRANAGYSLVSEVYVNNGYNYNSAPSSASGSNCSTLDKRTLKVRYEQNIDQPGKLLIEVADCPDNYLPVDDSDGFEPDTLDRKPAKPPSPPLRPTEQILLRSSGSFKRSPDPAAASPQLNRAFGSLREIYEAKTKALKQATNHSIQQGDSSGEEGRLLTLEERHSRRQRRLVQPDVIPPPRVEAPIYERPKPPRKVGAMVAEVGGELKPPLPPKNGSGRGVGRSTGGSAGTPAAQQGGREDSGYLSNDSLRDRESESEGGSLDEGQSESGAESVETHSVFFGTFRKASYAGFGSMDSGVEEGPNSGDLSSYLKSMHLQNLANKSILFTKG